MIGRNVRRIRTQRGMSLRTLAALSGLTAGHLSRVERGLANLDQRRSLLDVADALRVAPNELTGQPYDPQTRQEQAVRVAVTDLRDVLYGLGADGADGEHQRPGRDLAALRAAAERVDVLHADCALDALGPLLPDLLTDLYGHVATGDEPARQDGSGCCRWDCTPPRQRTGTDVDARVAEADATAARTGNAGRTGCGSDRRTSVRGRWRWRSSERRAAAYPSLPPGWTWTRCRCPSDRPVT